MDTRTKPNAAEVLDRAVQRGGLWLNTILLSLGFGLCCGFALLLVTLLSLAVTGEGAGQYLNLLGVFMPGYQVSSAGAWIGFFWAFIYAAISGAVVYQIYMRAVGRNQYRDLKGRRISDFTTMRISGWALGLALGVVAGLQLLLSTAWLVVRGTADESWHAALLAYYLPGYSVSIGGAFIGALWLFAYSILLSMLFGYVYNIFRGFRRRGTRSDTSDGWIGGS